MSSHKIGDLLAKVKRPGKVPKSEYLEDGEFPVIDQGRLPIAGYTNNPDVVLRSPLPITIFGDHTRAVKFAKIPFACGADGTQLLYPNNDSIDPTFFFYAVKNVDLSNYFYARHFKFLKEQKIELPPIRSQRRIASILSAYDDLIENNRRRIQLLEQAARLLYKEWFVHLRFPGYERAKIIDGVPEGWERKTLGEIADITMGQSPKSIYYNEDGDGLPFHQGVANFGVRFPSHQKYCAVQNRLANPGDILFSVRAPVGRINITMDKIVIGRGLAAIRSNRGQQNFLFYALKNHFFKDDLIGSGAIYAAITKKDLHEVELIQPSDLIARIFVERTTPIDCHIGNLQRTIDKLTQARDLLLPRLMNGEVDHEPLVARQTQRDAPTGAKAS